MTIAALDDGKSTILVIDDSPEDREILAAYLDPGSRGLPRILCAETGEEALALLDRAEEVECVVLDYNLPDVDGLDFLAMLRASSDPTLAIVVISGVGNEHVAAEAFRRGADDYLAKRSLTRGALRDSIRGALERKRARREGIREGTRAGTLFS